MNIKIKDGCVWIDGKAMAESSYQLFTDVGVDVEMSSKHPAEKHDDRAPYQLPLNAINRVVNRLLANLETRLESRVSSASDHPIRVVAEELRAERENWK